MTKRSHYNGKNVQRCLGCVCMTCSNTNGNRQARTGKPPKQCAGCAHRRLTQCRRTHKASLRVDACRISVHTGSLAEAPSPSPSHPAAPAARAARVCERHAAHSLASRAVVGRVSVLAWQRHSGVPRRQQVDATCGVQRRPAEAHRGYRKATPLHWCRNAQAVGDTAAAVAPKA